MILNNTHVKQPWNNSGTDREFQRTKKGMLCLDEVEEIITLRTHDPSVILVDQESLYLPEAVIHQLEQHINCIASMCKENPCTYDYATS